MSMCQPKVEMSPVARAGEGSDGGELQRATNDEADSVLFGYLEFLQQQIAKRPQDAVAADANQLRRIGKLVKGVALK